MRKAMVGTLRAGDAGQGLAVVEVLGGGVAVNILATLPHTFLLPF